MRAALAIAAAVLALTGCAGGSGAPQPTPQPAPTLLSPHGCYKPLCVIVTTAPSPAP